MSNSLDHRFDGKYEGRFVLRGYLMQVAIKPFQDEMRRQKPGYSAEVIP